MHAVTMRLVNASISWLLLITPSTFGSFQRDVVHQVEKGVRNAAFIGKQKSLHDELISKAVPLEKYKANKDILERQLEENWQGNGEYDLDDMYSFSGYSLKYAKCQPVQKFSEEAIENGDYSPMVTEDIVVLRLCPYKTCSASRQYGCHYNYVEYAIGVADYIHIMLDYAENRKNNMCDFCAKCSQHNRRRRKLNDDGGNDGQENGENDNGNENNGDANDNDNGDDANNNNGNDNANNDNNNNANGGNQDGENDDYQPYYDYNGYYWYDANDECYKYGSYCDEDYYEICNNQYDGNNDDDNYVAADEYINYVDCVELENIYGEFYYVRPRCDAYDGVIKMGVYYNNQCTKYAGDDVSINEFQIKFSEDIFEAFYDGSCIDCSESNYPPNFGSNSYMCNLIHGYGAQCVSNLEYDLFDGQQQDDSTECAFIESIRFGTYDEDGEISITHAKNAQPQVTTLQKAGLASSALFCCLLILYSCYLHHSMTNLLIKSLSHRELLPPSRHSKRRSPNPRRATKKMGKGPKGVNKAGQRDDDEEDDEWASPNDPI